MNYGTLEIELAERLNNYFTAENVANSFSAIPVPDNQSDQDRPFQKGIVNVEYFTSTYSPTKGTDQVSQSEQITIRLTFETRNRRGENGFYNLIEHTKRCLLGYKPANCTQRLTIDKYDLTFYEQNAALPYIDVKTEAMNVQLDDAGENLGAFKNLTIESQCPTP